MLLAIGEGLFFLPSSALAALTPRGMARERGRKEKHILPGRLEPIRPITFQTQLIH